MGDLLSYRDPDFQTLIYEMRLVNEFKLSLMYFALSHAVAFQGVFTLMTAVIPRVLNKTGRCLF